MGMFEVIAGVASIISIPLAIYYSHKSNTSTSEKARLDIIKTLSYRLGDAHNLSYDDIDSVYKSKLREHKISHANFNKNDILNDLKTDVISNAFLENSIKNDILYNLSTIELPDKTFLLSSNNKLYQSFIKVFISPLFNIYLVADIILCFVLSFPYIYDIISCYLINNCISNEFISNIFKRLSYDTNLHISLIILLVFSVICFLRKRYIKYYFDFF